MLRDRKRSQRGSVLSGVLIITAFLAIIAGGLMTELSSSFLLSRALMHRVDSEATVNSAVELALNGLQTSPIYNGCPTPSGANLNSQSAVATYVSCWPTVDARSLGGVTTPIVNAPEEFAVDGTHAVVAGPGGDEFLIGDSGGNFYRFQFGSTSASWTVALGGSITGPPQAMPNGFTHLIPVSNPTAGQGCSATNCVAVVNYGNQTPACYLAAAAAVSTRPAAESQNFPRYAFFGDASGMVFAYDTANCSAPEAARQASKPVVAGPVVFAGPSSRKQTQDEVYFVISDSSGSQLVHYEYVEGKNVPSVLNPISSLPLPAPSAVGLALDQSNSLPARLAITFAGGTVVVVQIQQGFGMSQLASTTLSSGIADAPSWCCGSSPNSIGVAQTHRMYVLDGNLNQAGSYSVGTGIYTSPAADAAGDWFFAADDGNLYEVPALTATPTLLTFGTGQLGQVRSSVQLGACGAWICAYLGSSNTNLYNVQLDARDAVLSACITSVSPSCSGANPHLWASVEVGSSSSAQTVHVQGWSYYSP